MTHWFSLTQAIVIRHNNPPNDGSQPSSGPLYRFEMLMVIFCRAGCKVRGLFNAFKKELSAIQMVSPSTCQRARTLLSKHLSPFILPEEISIRGHRIIELTDGEQKSPTVASQNAHLSLNALSAPFVRLLLDSRSVRPWAGRRCAMALPRIRSRPARRVVLCTRRAATRERQRSCSKNTVSIVIERNTRTHGASNIQPISKNRLRVGNWREGE